MRFQSHTRVGTKTGYTLAIIIWSIAGMGHAFARSVFSFGLMRFFLGVGESGNFPAAVKTVAEWVPEKEGPGYRVVQFGVKYRGSGRASHCYMSIFIVAGFTYLMAWLILELFIQKVEPINSAQYSGN